MSAEKKTRPPRVAATSAPIVPERLDALRELVPEAFTEAGIDWDKLRTALGEAIDDRPDRYRFEWAGKRDAIALLQRPSAATLVPVPEESVNFDETQHVFIEGENLEVLKLLYRSYAGRVKMIYIDPPYNTGNDFIYRDDYSQPLQAYLDFIAPEGATPADARGEAERASRTGRIHSDWLNMMYPRLFLARQLLRDDGVIFISCDDNEVHHLRMVMNELFGEENFVGQIVWKSRTSEDTRAKTGLSTDHEYIMCFRRTSSGVLRGAEKDLSKFSNPDDDARGPWRSADLTGLASKDRRPNLHYDLTDPETGITYRCPPMGWRFEPKVMDQKIAEGRVLWPSDPTGRPRHKLFQNEMASVFKNASSILTEFTTSDGTRELNELLGSGVFPFPKPTGLIRFLVEQAAGSDGIVLDFFAGAGSTAQAVMDANDADDGQRRYIVVQLPESIDATSAAGQAGFTSVADIAKERIRRYVAARDKHAQASFPEATKRGMKAFRLEASCFAQWNDEHGSPDSYVTALELFGDPLRSNGAVRTVLYEVALKEAGMSLTCRIEQIEEVKTNTVWRVTDPDQDRHFHICLDDKLDPETPAALGLSGDTDLFVCRDVALDDTLAANLALQCRLRTI